MDDWTSPCARPIGECARSEATRSLLFLTALFLLALGCSGTPTTPSDGPGGDDQWAVTGKNAADARLLASPVQPPSADEYAGVGMHHADLGRVVFEMTNEERQKRGRPPLTRDITLTRIACWHNQDMLAHDYMGHQDADGRMPGDRMMREHRRLIGSAGENVFEGSALLMNTRRVDVKKVADTIMDGWMKSSGHRANILRLRFTHLGACVTRAASVGKATQVFAAVWAYLEEPLPWSMSPGGSLAVSITPVRADQPPAEYAFVPVGEPLDEAFEGDGRARAFRGTLQLPDRPGVYGSRFLFLVDNGRYVIVSGPRVRVEPGQVDVISRE